jgi:hypothetical protein
MNGIPESQKCEYVQNVNQLIGIGRRGWQKPKTTDLIGKRFGSLTAIKFYGFYMDNWSWLCKCDCGKDIIVHRKRLMSGDAKSCGCMKQKTCKFPEYKTWDGMKYRCRDPRCKDYPAYGGRGIKICERWEKSFKNFIADMGRRPTPQHTIERIDNDGNYEPSNCKWATKTEQRHNNRIPKNNTTGVNGVQWNQSRNRYYVVIGSCGKQIHVGCFKTLSEAAEARRQAEIKYWGK